MAAKILRLVLVVSLMFLLSHTTMARLPEIRFRPFMTIELDAAVTSVAWQPSGTLLAVGTAHGVSLVNFPTGQTEQWLELGHAMPYSLDWCTDERLVVGDNEGTVHVRDIANPVFELRFRIPDAYVYNVDCSPDGNRVVVSSREGNLVVYNITTQEIIALPEGEYSSGVLSAYWHPNNHQIVFEFYTDIYIWNVDENSVVNLVTNVSAATMALSPDGQWLALSQVINISPVKPYQYTFSIVSEDVEIFKTILQDINLVLAWHPKSHLIALCNRKNQIHIWDVVLGRQVAYLSGSAKDWDIPFYNVIAWSPDGRLLADIGTEGTVRIWEMQYE